MIQHLTKCGMQVPGDPLGQGTKVGFQFNICGNDGNNKIYLLLCLWRFQEMCAYRTLISLSLINNSADSLKWWYSLLLCDLENSTSEQQRKKKYLYIGCVWAGVGSLPHVTGDNIHCALTIEILQVFGILAFQLFKNMGHYELYLLGWLCDLFSFRITHALLPTAV